MNCAASVGLSMSSTSLLCRIAASDAPSHRGVDQEPLRDLAEDGVRSIALDYLVVEGYGMHERDFSNVQGDAVAKL